MVPKPIIKTDGENFVVFLGTANFSRISTHFFGCNHLVTLEFIVNLRKFNNAIIFSTTVIVAGPADMQYNHDKNI